MHSTEAIIATWFSNGKVISAAVNATYYKDNEMVNEVPNIYKEFKVAVRILKMIKRDIDGKLLTVITYDYYKAFSRNSMSSVILMMTCIYIF